MKVARPRPRRSRKGTSSSPASAKKVDKKVGAPRAQPKSPPEDVRRLLHELANTLSALRLRVTLLAHDPRGPLEQAANLQAIESSFRAAETQADRLALALEGIQLEPVAKKPPASPRARRRAPR